MNNNLRSDFFPFHLYNFLPPLGIDKSGLFFFPTFMALLPRELTSLPYKALGTGAREAPRAVGLLAVALVGTGRLGARIAGADAFLSGNCKFFF